MPPEKGTLYGKVPDEVVVEENGLKMSVDVKNGQKTGYFLDQKENRFALPPLCRGRQRFRLFLQQRRLFFKRRSDGGNRDGGGHFPVGA